MNRRAGAVALGLTLLCGGVDGGIAHASPTAYDAARRHPAVIGREVIGHSVQGRPITAWHLGDSAVTPAADEPTVVLVATMHGDEPASQHLLTSLVDGPAIDGVDLWVIPVLNPDGLAADTRKNADGVDLNRNFPRDWIRQDGDYESGPRPASEPETRAMMAFLTRVHPDRMLSFHQPLDGVDRDAKRPAFSVRVSRALHLPLSTFDCDTGCHGTMTSWFEHRFAGSAITVEYAAHPGLRRLQRQAPGQVLSVFGARRVSHAFDGPASD